MKFHSLGSPFAVQAGVSLMNLLPFSSTSLTFTFCFSAIPQLSSASFGKATILEKFCRLTVLFPKSIVTGLLLALFFLVLLAPLTVLMGV